MVDDDPGIRHVLSDLLEDEGFAVATARDGIEALEICERGRPDLMILDVNMPRLDGAQVLDELSVRDWRGFPILMLTAGSPPDQLAGRVEHITGKPFDLEALLRVIGGLLRAAEARPNREGANEGGTI